jgi:hypothetical protein
LAGDQRRTAAIAILDDLHQIPSLVGAAQPALEPRSVALGGLAVEQQRQPFGVRQITRVVLRLQLDEGVGQLRIRHLARCALDHVQRRARIVDE